MAVLHPRNQGSPLQPVHHTFPSWPARAALNTVTILRPPGGRDAYISLLNEAVEDMIIVKESSRTEVVKYTLGTVSDTLTVIRVCFLLFRDDQL